MHFTSNQKFWNCNPREIYLIIQWIAAINHKIIKYYRFSGHDLEETLSASEDEQLTILEQYDMDIGVSSTSGTISEEQQQRAESLQEWNKRLKEEIQTDLLF